MKEKFVCSVCGADLTGETVNHFERSNSLQRLSGGKDRNL